MWDLHREHRGPKTSVVKLLMKRSYYQMIFHIIRVRENEDIQLNICMDLSQHK